MNESGSDVLLEVIGVLLVVFIALSFALSGL